MKVSGKSHSGESTMESFMLAKCSVSSKNCARGGSDENQLDENKLEKSRIEKTPLKNTKFGYSVLGLRKHNFKIKNNHFEKSHNVENC